MEDEDGNFFGFNYNSTVKVMMIIIIMMLIMILQARDGLGASIIGSLNYMYDNIVESYVEDIYTGVIEDYTIATVKVGSKTHPCLIDLRE